MTAATPSGVVTFVFTDVEGSTRRWEADANAIPDGSRRSPHRRGPPPQL
jgi:class 3 adenylate cyclase